MVRGKTTDVAGRGRGRGAGPSSTKRTGVTPRADPSVPSTSRETPPAPMTFEAELGLVRHNLHQTKKILAKMPKERSKELERVLLPDAPPRKRARKNSPDRTACRLMVGTPTTPPPPKPQPWQIQRGKTTDVAGRGRGRGAGPSSTTRTGATPRADPSVPSTSRETPPAPMTFEAELGLVRHNLHQTKKILAKMPKERSKELERVLLPDAPPRKRARKNSPDRTACRLMVGTPTTPPPPKPQPWQIQALARAPADIDLDAPPSVASEAQSSVPLPLLCDFTSGGLRGDNILHGLVGPPAATAKVAQGLPGLQEVMSTPPQMAARRSSSSSDDSSPPPSMPEGEIHIDPAALCRTTLSPAPSTESVTAPTESTPVPVPDAAVPVPAPVPDAVASCSSGQSRDVVCVGSAGAKERVSDWLADLSDAPDTDFANEAPAFALDELDAVEAVWLTQHDIEADRLMTDMMTGDDQLTFDWSNDVNTFLGQREEFRGQSGPQFLIDENTKPVDVFLKYFTDEVLDLIVRETNRYASHDLSSMPLKRRSRFSRLKVTDRSEMLVFTAMLIFQGLCPLPVEADYWSTTGYLALKNFRTLMSINRFIMLKRMLHFTGNETVPTQTDDVKLRKIRPLLDLLNAKFSELYLPSRDIAIDESLLKWHGRLDFAQKITTKAAKVGVKSYELCESNTGYLWKFFVYTGKGGQTHGQTDANVPQDAQEQVTAPPSVTAKIVMDLVRPLLNRGHTLTMDNFYNSPLLARYLKAKGTDCLGTLRVNREFVPASIKGVSKGELRPGELVQTFCRDMTILLWRDKNIISMISTFHRGEVGGKEKYGNYKYKPQAVLDYNLSMGGVDKKDQLLASHPIERTRNQAWYKKVYRRLLNVTILNAFIVYKSHFRTVQQRQFRLTLANQLVERFKPPVIERPMDVNVVRVIQSGTRQRCIVSGNHFLGPGESKSARCVWCKKSRTKLICEECHVPLCVKCMRAYHTA